MGLFDGSPLTKVVFIDNFRLPEKAVGNLSGKKTIVDKSYKVGAICRARGDREYLGFPRRL